MRENSEDLRVVKTQQAIRRAFEELLTEMDYEKITVKLLCERAMINRKTFYAHYAYLDELLEEYISRLAETYLGDVGTSSGISSLPDRVRRFFLYIPKIPPIAEKMVMSCGGAGFFNRVSMVIREKNPSEMCGLEHLPEEEQDIVTEYLNTSCLIIYRRWVQDGKKIPPEKLAELAVMLITGGTGELLKYLDAQ
ncbi:MAG: TetR/AcrR family transcriptional regulator [Lachnospiraceae bacterium]|nr:TetR/AcrR family transcriptional regulator [Lachnospiraceae bacterium]